MWKRKRKRKREGEVVYYNGMSSTVIFDNKIHHIANIGIKKNRIKNVVIASFFVFIFIGMFLWL